MANPPTSLHFVLFPLTPQGHTLPMVDIARMLAHHGPTVTIITTPLNANRFKHVIERAIEARLKIQVVELRLPLVEVGLPEGCETLDLLPSPELKGKLFAAMDLLQAPAENVLRELRPAPSCIISDGFFPWTTEVARRFDIPRLVFYGPGCFWLLCMHVASTMNVLDGVKSDSERFVLPAVPNRIEVTKGQFNGFPKADTAEVEAYGRIAAAEKGAYGIVVNSFRELESEYAQQLAKAKDKKVWCIGPVSLSNKSNLDIAERGNKPAINQNDCFKWLDSREPGSVVYVCLGSIVRASAEQAIELGLGLESTNQPFIWCIRNGTEDLERWFSEDGFEERVKDRGLIVHGWAPQVMILSHRAVGGFLTHCGWNSTLEGICAGLPMVTWPHFADQFLNEKFIVGVLKIGIGIGVDRPVVYGQEDVFGVLVKKEAVKRAVERIMDKEEGNERRMRARELGCRAKRATEEGGSSHLDVMSMIQDIAQLLTK